MTGIHLTQFVERSARQSPDNPAIRFAGRQSTWRSFNQSTRNIAGGLETIGVGPDDRIAILALNSDRYAELLFSVWRLSAIAVAFNTRWSVDEVNFALADSEPSILAVDDALAKLLPQLDLPNSVKHVLFIGDDEAPANSLLITELAGRGNAVEALRRGGDHPAGIFYTGGTTGRSKGVVLSHTALVTTLLAVQAEHEHGDEIAPLLCVLPMFHLAGAQLAIAAAMTAAPIIILPGFDLDEVLRCIERENVDTLTLVPSMWGMLLAHPKAAETDLSSLRNTGYGASPMPEGTLRSCLERLPHARFFQGYGQTEVGGICTLLGAADHDPDAPTSHRLRSAGQTISFAEIKVVDERGDERPRGTVGELMIRSSGNMLGYWNRP